jgi:mannose-6-phosphate isomerase-like protein (cupin superfamily)
MAGDLGWRCVVTSHDADGRPIFQSDKTLTELETRAAMRLGRILVLPGVANSANDGAVDAAGAGSGPRSLTVDALVVGPTADGLPDPDPDAGPPEWFEVYIVVQGELHVTVGSDEAVLLPGEVFVPRGRPYGVRTSATEETRLVRVRSVADPNAAVAVPTAVRGSSGPARRVRRVVGGTDATGRPAIVHDGDPAVMFVIGDESEPDVGLADVWELGGLVGSAEQGGDAPEPYELEPRASGLKILNLELKPVENTGPPNEGGWHATATIDVDIVIDGSVEMYLPALPPVTLNPGDTLLQRGTNHLWRSVGERSLRMVTVMIGVLAKS